MWDFWEVSNDVFCQVVQVSSFPRAGASYWIEISFIKSQYTEFEYRSWGLSLGLCSAAVKSHNIDLEDPGSSCSPVCKPNFAKQPTNLNLQPRVCSPTRAHRGHRHRSATRRRTGVKGVKLPWLVVPSWWPGVQLISPRDAPPTGLPPACGSKYTPTPGKPSRKEIKVKDTQGRTWKRANPN